MTRRVRLIAQALLAIGALLVAFVATTWWALESSGVAVIETRAADGTARSTHVWYAETNGELWLEAGTPENPWFTDVQRNPALDFNTNGRVVRYVAEPIEDPTGHIQIRSLLREKYGMRDVWIGLLFDTSRSVAVRLLPAGP